MAAWCLVYSVLSLIIVKSKQVTQVCSVSFLLGAREAGAGPESCPGEELTGFKSAVLIG